MSVIASVPEAISELTSLVQAGNIPAARKLSGKLLNVATTRELWLIKRIADLLENRPRTAVEMIRHMWATAPEETREADQAIIAACMAKKGEQRRRPQTGTGTAPRWNGRNNYQASGTVTVGQRDELRRRRRTRQEQSDAVAFARYRDQRAGVVEGAQAKDGGQDRADTPQPYASGFDYDETMMRDLSGLPCLVCRSEYRDPETHAMGSASGLCENCAKPWRKGLAPLPEDSTRADLLQARCDWVVATFPRPRGVLLAEYNAAPGTGDQCVIQAWVADFRAGRATCDWCFSRNDLAHLEIDEDSTPVASSVVVCRDCRKQAEKDAEAGADPAGIADGAAGQHDQCDKCGAPGARFELCAKCNQAADADAAMQASAPVTGHGSCDLCGSPKRLAAGLCVECRVDIADHEEQTLAQVGA